jgi:adenosylmethionine-8-amino-7-oxononanoate aminotransferase
LPKVFFSDNGSTAIEVALKMAVQYFQLTGESTRCRFAAFENAYHGDTAGAASVGGIAAFHGRFSGLHFPVDRVGSLDDLVRMERPEELAAVVIEPLIQGAAGMRLWPAGMLRALRDWCDRYGVLLILDEVMTGFGRTGAMFACQKEDVVPDFLALAKGLTGGYLPLAATLTTDRVFDAFLGTAEEQKTLYYGHSYAGNAVGCAAAIASLMVFEEEQTLVHLQPKIRFLSDQLELLKGHPHVIDVRQCGFIAGIEIARNPQAGERYPWTELRGARVCMEARKHGLLTRPVLDTLTLMPPLCATEDQIAEAVRSLRLGINAVCGG